MRKILADYLAGGKLSKELEPIALSKQNKY